MTPTLAYPRNTSGFIRQCAWCWAVADADGRYTLTAPGKLPQASHGICPSCKSVMRREIDAAA